MDIKEKRVRRQKWIETLGGFDGGPGPTEKYKNKILVDCIEDLEDSINQNSKKSGRLSTVMIWLTCVIAIGTILLAVIGGTDLCFKIKTLQQTNETTNVSAELKK